MTAPSGWLVGSAAAVLLLLRGAVIGLATLGLAAVHRFYSPDDVVTLALVLSIGAALAAPPVSVGIWRLVRGRLGPRMRTLAWIAAVPAFAHGAGVAALGVIPWSYVAMSVLMGAAAVHLAVEAKAAPRP